MTDPSKTSNLEFVKTIFVFILDSVVLPVPILVLIVFADDSISVFFASIFVAITPNLSPPPAPSAEPTQF